MNAAMPRDNEAVPIEADGDRVPQPAAAKPAASWRSSMNGGAPSGEPVAGERIGDFVRETASALAGNTGRAVRSDLAIYAGWCAAEGVRALPATPETLAAFVDAMAESRAPATVRRYLATIALAHRSVDAGGIVSSPPVKLALKRMHLKHGRRQGQAHGLTWPLRQRLLEAAGDRLIDVRDRALLAVAYDAMLRRSELTSLRVSDLMEEIGGHGTLLVRYSKTDAEGEGEIVWVGPDTVRLVKRWRKRAGVDDGVLFRSIDKGGTPTGRPLPPGQVARIFKEMARKAGLPDSVVRGLSGHSARVGAAQDMIAAGMELPAILQAGRWKSASMVNRYGERLLARRSAAARLARKQGRQ